jgi:hypothetical protein
MPDIYTLSGNTDHDVPDLKNKKKKLSQRDNKKKGEINE